jgi:hypothetical protein
MAFLRFSKPHCYPNSPPVVVFFFFFFFNFFFFFFFFNFFLQHLNISHRRVLRAVEYMYVLKLRGAVLAPAHDQALLHGLR